MGDTAEPTVHGSISYLEGAGADDWVGVWFPDLPWQFHVRTAMIDGTRRVVGLSLEPRLDPEGNIPPGFESRDVVVSTLALRSIPLTRIHDAVRAHRERDYRALLAAMRRIERKPGKPWPDEHYRQVAEVYEEAVGAGLPPLAAVADQWGVSRPMASKHVRGARERGYLSWPATSKRQESVAGLTDSVEIGVADVEPDHERTT